MNNLIKLLDKNLEYEIKEDTIYKKSEFIYS